MFKIILAASAITLATVATASAAPLAPATAVINVEDQSLVIDVQNRKRPRHQSQHHRQRDRHVYQHRDRYHGWHRYSARPYNWQTRGCIAAGPIWVCP